MHEGNRTLSQEWKNCIAVCFRCVEICETCSDDMIGMPAHGDTQLTERCISLCLECADISVMAAQWMSRMSPLSERLCRLCAEACDICAAACKEHAPRHALCGPCAEQCRQCAELCRAISATEKAA
jgi:hypothetical protein